MTNEQFAAALVAFLLANAATLRIVMSWAIKKAIAYTHLERDVKELQQQKLLQDKFNEKALLDMKGLSMKFDKLKGDK